MKLGFSSKTVKPTTFVYISHESKKGYYRSIVAGWDEVNKHFFIDLMEVDLIIWKPWHLPSFNWRYFKSFEWLKGN